MRDTWRALTAAFALLALGAGSAQAVSSAEAIRQLNQQRIANGIPGVHSVGALARGCAKHNAYMALNGTLTHFEKHGKPGFTPAGNRAGRSSVLSYGSPPWSGRLRNPWEAAPIHLAQLLPPSLAVSGYAEARRYACAQTLAEPRRPEPAANLVYTYPGPGAGIYPALQAAELPYTPGELIGVTGRTGPYLYVMVDGPIASPCTAMAGSRPPRCGMPTATPCRCAPSTAPTRNCAATSRPAAS